MWVAVVGFKDKLEAKIDKLGNRLEKLPSDLSRLKESVAFSINPNRRCPPSRPSPASRDRDVHSTRHGLPIVPHSDRHDEAWEKEIDRIRTEIAQSHRFESFGAPREGNLAKWYIGTPNTSHSLALSTVLTAC